MPLILASASLRRAELLTAAGFDFQIEPANVDERVHEGEDPTAYALRVARAKADHILKTRTARDPVLAADTVVVGGGHLMGKPADDRDAASMLKTLSGSVHEVHTAVVLHGRRGGRSELVTTRVRFQPLTDAEIEWYIRTGEPAGKAGAYAIQGRAARFIDWIDGSWSNVVGLPISAVYRLLKELDELTETSD
ncbi:MAG TPA: Maf family protein [Vicinamibacterales bacterium]